MKRNTNFLDMFDFIKLGNQGYGDGITSGDAFNHETLEVYYKVSINLTPDQSHDYDELARSAGAVRIIR